MNTSEKIKYLTIEEVTTLRQIAEERALVDLAKGRRRGVVEWMLLDLVSSMGLRATELRSLRVSDMHLSSRSYLTVRTLKRRADVVDQLPLEGTLREHIKTFLQWKEASGESLAADASLLVSNRGQGYSLRAVEYAAKRMMAEAGLDSRFSIHSLRHTTAVHLLRRTGNLRLVQKVMRHASISTTEVYGSVMESDIRANLAGLFDTS